MPNTFSRTDRHFFQKFITNFGYNEHILECSVVFVITRVYFYVYLKINNMNISLKFNEIKHVKKYMQIRIYYLTIFCIYCTKRKFLWPIII